MKRVIVTGASGDIGSAILERLSQLEYTMIGLDVVERQKKEDIERFFKVDLRRSDEIEHVCGEIRENHSPIWGIVCCAGVYPIEKLQDYTLELWDEVHAVNLRSAFQISQLLYPSIVNGGRIVIIASGAGHVGSRDVGYSASKAGALGLVRSLAKSLAPHGILVNAVSPGVIRTKMSARMSPENVKQYIDNIPLKRLGVPNEVSICVSFLLDEQNSYMTGASLDVNGGLYTR